MLLCSAAVRSGSWLQLSKYREISSLACERTRRNAFNVVSCQNSREIKFAPSSSKEDTSNFTTKTRLIQKGRITVTPERGAFARRPGKMQLSSARAKWRAMESNATETAAHPPAVSCSTCVRVLIEPTVLVCMCATVCCVCVCVRGCVCGKTNSRARCERKERCKCSPFCSSCERIARGSLMQLASFQRSARERTLLFVFAFIHVGHRKCYIVYFVGGRLFSFRSSSARR